MQTKVTKTVGLESEIQSAVLAQEPVLGGHRDKVIDAILDTAESNVGYTFAETLNLKGVTKPDFVEYLAHVCDLTEKEVGQINAWFDSGVRWNTFAWLQATRYAYGQPRAKDINGAVFATMFADIYNRADEVFDRHRKQLFLDADGVHVLTDQLNYLPILSVGEDGYATVGELQAVLFKLMKAFYRDKDEYDFLRWRIDEFVQSATVAQRMYESKSVYSLQDAVILREQTLMPMSDAISDIYRGLTMQLNDDERAKDRNRAVSGVVLSVQVIDDFCDLREDLEAGNVNLFAGLLRDNRINPWNFSRDDQEHLGTKFPKIAQKLKELYISYADAVDADARKLIEETMVPPPLGFLLQHNSDD